MSDTPNLGLPYVAAEQAQKHVTVNEALRALDALVQLSVRDRDLAAPPGAPGAGDRYIIGPAPTGAWEGHVGEIAAWQDGVWGFYLPREGWLAWVADEDVLVAWDGAGWMTAGSGGGGGGSELQNLTLLGVGTAADAANPFSAKLNKALWAAKTGAEGGDGDLRYTMNKESAADTLSLLMQSAFSGRAEIGLTGDDNLSFKVSADGAAWKTALVFDRVTGRPSFPSGGVRETLIADRIYYVRSDGSDGNTGLANNAGGAFLTIQKAVDVAAALDMAGLQVTIQVGAGTYTGQVALKATMGQQPPIIVGDEATPANVLLHVTSPAQAAAILNDAGGGWHLRGFKLQTTTAGRGLWARNGGVVKFQNLDFGACAGDHTYVAANSTIEATGNYRISGGSPGGHWVGNGWLICSGRTITLSGTPNFGNAFAFAGRGATLDVFGNTFSGAATGKRFATHLNGVIFNNGAGATYFPGDIAGTEAAWDPVQ